MLQVVEQSWWAPRTTVSRAFGSVLAARAIASWSASGSASPTSSRCRIPAALAYAASSRSWGTAPASAPRRDTLIVVYGDADAPAHQAINVLRQLGYSRVHALLGGLDGWIVSGGEIFQDVNVPSKAFGELVESISHTPSLIAQHVQALIDSGEPPVIVDARRFDEFHTMSIPTATSIAPAENSIHAVQAACVVPDQDPPG
ncbi:hypothetical protein ACBJ59_58795 [Nonomuraea sp. MTCD27]|uniref:hypothetical protein n=1 Tax=Nonomuraea sp. MTCD27 TaxID=1676747 RepID=UPI0035BF0F9B